MMLNVFKTSAMASRRAMLFRPFSVGVDKLKAANSQGASFNDWNGLLSQVKREDVLACKDVNWMSNFVRSVALSGDAVQAEAVNEYHRKQFRKISTEDAIATLKELGAPDSGSPVNAQALQSQFWVWETLEEAIIGQVDEMELDTFFECFRAFLVNNKGSTFLMEQFETRIYREGVKSPFQAPVDLQTFVNSH